MAHLENGSSSSNNHHGSLGTGSSSSSSSEGGKEGGKERSASPLGGGAHGRHGSYHQEDNKGKAGGATKVFTQVREGGREGGILIFRT
jgi:hypothetical protein